MLITTNIRNVSIEEIVNEGIKSKPNTCLKRKPNTINRNIAVINAEVSQPSILNSLNTRMIEIEVIKPPNIFTQLDIY